MATTNNSAAQAGTATKKRGQFKETWRRLKKNRMAMIGLTVVVFLVLISIFADVLFDYYQAEYPDPSPGPQRRALAGNRRIRT